MDAVIKRVLALAARQPESPPDPRWHAYRGRYRHLFSDGMRIRAHIRTFPQALAALAKSCNDSGGPVSG